MRVKLMTFRYSAQLGGFDDTHLDTPLIRDKEMIAFREHFYVANEVPHVSGMITYHDAVVPPAALDAAREIAPRPAQWVRASSAATARRMLPGRCPALDPDRGAVSQEPRASASM